MSEDLTKRVAELEAWRSATIGGFNGDAFAPLALQFGYESKVDGRVTFVRKAGDPSAHWQKLADALKEDPLKPFASAIADASTPARQTQSDAPADPAGPVDALLKRSADRAARVNPLSSRRPA